MLILSGDSDMIRRSVWGIIINRDGDILVARRAPGIKNPGMINFPGGGVKPGEFPVNSVYREIKEEVGIGKNNLVLLEILNFPVDEGITGFIFQTESPRIKLNFESSDYWWKSLENLSGMKNLHRHTKTLLEKKQRIKYRVQQILKIRNRKNKPGNKSKNKNRVKHAGEIHKKSSEEDNK